MLGIKSEKLLLNLEAKGYYPRKLKTKERALC